MQSIKEIFLRLKRNHSTLITWVTPDSIQIGIDTIDSYQIKNLPLVAQAAIDQADGLKTFSELSKNNLDCLLNSQVLVDLDQETNLGAKYRELKIEIQANPLISDQFKNIFCDLGFTKTFIRKSDPTTSRADFLVLFNFLPVNLDIPHLLVNFIGESLLIGPLVVPKETSCLNCLYLHRKDLNPNWPKIAFKFENYQINMDKALIYQATLTTATTIKNYLKASKNFSLKNQIVELNLNKNFYQVRELTTHPSCGCKW
jgi:hypothetical protein